MKSACWIILCAFAAAMVGCGDSSPSGGNRNSDAGESDAIVGLDGDVVADAGSDSGLDAAVGPCPATQILCDGLCVDPLTNRFHCGASGECLGATAGTDCSATGEVCVSGQCAISCPGNQIICADQCVDPLSDQFFCGASGDCSGAAVGTDCSATGEVCVNGQCAVSCPENQIVCDGQCVDPLNDSFYCGASGDCLAPNDGDNCRLTDEVCVSGACELTCPGNQIVCDDQCVDPQRDRIYCGAVLDCLGTNDGTDCSLTRQVCSYGECVTSCPTHQIDCNGRCVEPQTDPIHCGAVLDCVGTNDGTDCRQTHQVCVDGECEYSCPAGQMVCSDTCVDPLTNRFFCGASDDCLGANNGLDCSVLGQVCVDGLCQVSCPPGQIVCADRCVDPQTDPVYCGAVLDCEGTNDGTDCRQTNQVCVDGQCAHSCPVDQIICDNTCIDPDTDRFFCGASGDCLSPNEGEDCSLTGKVCVDGLCEWSCPPGQIRCGSICIHPDDDPRFCGASGDCDAGNDGMDCTLTGRACEAGQCVCAAPLVFCDGVCINPESTTQYCGASGDCGSGTEGEDCSLTGRTCVGGECVCTAPFVYCNGQCIDPDSDPQYCGAFDQCQPGTEGEDCGASGRYCDTGLCACSGDMVFCGGECVDPRSHSRYCGASGDCVDPNDGMDCTLTFRYCEAAQCQCPLSMVFCGTRCVDPLSDPEFCGASGDCVDPLDGVNCDDASHVEEGFCAGGSCGVARCETLWGNCDGVPGTGCEMYLVNNDLHCGGCDQICSAGADCYSTTCRCNSDFGDVCTTDHGDNCAGNECKCNGGTACSPPATICQPGVGCVVP